MRVLLSALILAFLVVPGASDGGVEAGGYKEARDSDVGAEVALLLELDLALE